MVPLTTAQQVDTSRFLAWLTATLEEAGPGTPTVQLAILDEPDGTSTVAITIRGLPGPLAGLGVRPVEVGNAPVRVRTPGGGGSPQAGAEEQSRRPGPARQRAARA